MINSAAPPAPKELIFHTKKYCVHTKYQPTVFNIKGPRCRVQRFCCIENSVHLEDFQHRGRRWAHHQGMTSVMRVAHYFLLLYDGVFCGPRFKAAQCKSQYCGCTLYAHHIFNIKGPCCSLQCFCWMENNVNLKDFTIGKGGGYITKAWQGWLGLHTIYFHDVVYCRPHYKVAQGKLHFKSAPTIYHNQCREVSKSQANSRG